MLSCVFKNSGVEVQRKRKMRVVIRESVSNEEGLWPRSFLHPFKTRTPAFSRPETCIVEEFLWPPPHFYSDNSSLPLHNPFHLAQWCCLHDLILFFKEPSKICRIKVISSVNTWGSRTWKMVHTHAWPQTHGQGTTTWTETLLSPKPSPLLFLPALSDLLKCQLA